MANLLQSMAILENKQIKILGKENTELNTT